MNTSSRSNSFSVDFWLLIHLCCFHLSEVQGDSGWNEVVGTTNTTAWRKHTQQKTRRSRQPWWINLGICGVTFMFLEVLRVYTGQTGVNILFICASVHIFPHPTLQLLISWLFLLIILNVSFHQGNPSREKEQSSLSSNSNIEVHANNNVHVGEGLFTQPLGDSLDCGRASMAACCCQA